ncbi:hypothetical protein EIN_064230 [Entamoeba invadens IP1]|uniref:Uncharacterized protein n=1 Tax=Entamoeba invadens IP1 TaxID=370355 RepID=A0A0A1TZZ1_ENTIV|nr:hypothetical protein EIN_064230 [Entamoeba invadens IP1]ELP84208.1 hypothetical protein EIN_064230 [Entamoeba invadens IP1]|eukprot:XP_004183554.1 hypothetical protein EIN_064230 [Entamoeba invadens IP1]
MKAHSRYIKISCPRSEGIQTNTQLETSAKGIESVIMYRRYLTRFKQPLTQPELDALDVFVEPFRTQAISVTIPTQEEVTELNGEKLNCTVVVVHSKFEKTFECVDILNRIELYCTTKILFGFWNEDLAKKFEKKFAASSTFCLCVGHFQHKFIRYAPRINPEINFL